MKNKPLKFNYHFNNNKQKEILSMKKISRTLESYKMVQKFGSAGLPMNSQYVYKEREGQINGIKAGDLIEVVGFKNYNQKRLGRSVFTHVIMALSDAKPYSKDEIHMDVKTDSAPAWGRFLCQRVS